VSLFLRSHDAIRHQTKFAGISHTAATVLLDDYGH